MKRSLGVGIGSAALAAVLATSLATAAPKKPAAKPDLAAGKKVFDTMGCMGCHKVAGKGQTSGPDLSHVGKEHDAVWLAKKIKDPKSTKKDSIMPPFGGSDKDLKAVSAYLASLK